MTLDEQTVQVTQLRSQLSVSEQQLQLISDQLPAMLWTTDLKLRFTTMRGRELSVLELLESEILGTTVAELFAGSHAAAVMSEIHRRAISGGSTSIDFEWRHHWYHAHVEPLRDEEGEVLGTIGVSLDVTNEQKLRRDVHAAHQVQQHLLPKRAPRIAGFDIAGRCYPAEDCSGDFFDFIPLAQQRLAVVLADVSGHGFGPAILAAGIRSYLRMAAVLGNQIHEMLALANRLLINDSELTPFATVFSLCLDSRSNTILFASAGHPAFLLHAQGNVTRLETPCIPIGIRADEIFALSPRQAMQPDDVLLMFSDGVYEARSPAGEFFGIRRATEMIQQYRNCDAETMVHRLHAAVVSFAKSESLSDDLTVVVVKRTGPSDTPGTPLGPAG